MKYIHVRNIEKYQPGYKDRQNIWAKIYEDMIIGNEDTEILDEVAWSRLVKIIVLQTCRQKPIPFDENYLRKRGFDFGLQSLQQTIDSLSHFIEIIDVTEEPKVCNTEPESLYPRLEENRVEKRARNKRAFQQPTLEELTLALKDGGLEAATALVEAKKFLNHYETVGWVVGRARKPMASWRGAVATWIDNHHQWRVSAATEKHNPNKKLRGLPSA